MGCGQEGRQTGGDGVRRIFRPKKIYGLGSRTRRVFRLVSITGEQASSVRTDEARRASPNLLAKPPNYRRVTTRTPGHLVGGDEESNAREIRSRLLPTDDYRRMAKATSGGRDGSGLHRAL